VEATRAGARGLSVGDVINQTFSIYGQNAAALLGTAVIVWIVFGFFAGLLDAGGGWLAITLAGVIRMVGLALYAGFVVRLVQDVRDGRRDMTVGDLVSAAAPAILSLILFGIIFAVGVAVGLALLIVPGLILITFWSLGAPAIVVERADPFGAFGRSWRLVRGDAWSVFGTLVVVFLIVVAIDVVLGIVATPIGNGANIVASIVSSVLTAPIFAVAVSVMFFERGGGRTATAPTPEAGSPPPSAPAV
jgi:hypothetical protein